MSEYVQVRGKALIGLKGYCSTIELSTHDRLNTSPEDSEKSKVKKMLLLLNCVEGFLHFLGSPAGLGTEG